MTHEERLGLLADIIEVFEDFLDERGIVIKNDEKEEDPDNASNIYGTDYGRLEDEIEGILVAWKLIDPEYLRLNDRASMKKGEV